VVVPATETPPPATSFAAATPSAPPPTRTRVPPSPTEAHRGHARAVADAQADDHTQADGHAQPDAQWRGLPGRIAFSGWAKAAPTFT
jgi:hypothetical protein